MKTSPISFPMLAGGFCGFIAAAIIGWSLAGGASAPAISTDEPTAVAEKSNRPSRPSRLSAAATLAGKRMASVRAAANPEARLRATIDLANSLPVSEIAAWMDGGYFNLRGGAELTLFSKILMERWMKEDAEGLVEWSIKNNTYQGQSILAKWAKEDPQRAIDFFKSHPNDIHEMLALRTIADEQPDLVLSRLQELAASGISKDASGYVSGIIYTLAEKSPAALEAALASLPSSLHFRAECALTGQRLKSSFATEIRSLWELPNGWKIFEIAAQQNREFAGDTFAELANMPAAWRSSLASNAYSFMNRDVATQWLDADLSTYGFTPEQAKSIQVSALHYMDSSHPEAVIQRMVGLNLAEDARQNLIQNAISHAQGDLKKTEAVLALLTSEADQTYARAILKGRSDDNGDPFSPQKSTDEWLEQLSVLDVKNGNAYLFINAIQNWDSEKKSQLKNQFNQLPAEKKQVVAQIIATRTDSDSGTSELQGDAIRYLAAHPEVLPELKPENASESLTAMTSSYAIHLAKQDADAAAEWVRTLPAGDAKSWAEKNLASNWAQYDPKAVEQWLKTLPAANREEVKKFMKN